MPNGDLGPNERRLKAVAENKQNCNGVYVKGIGEVFYAEYGCGAELVNELGYVIADFPSHLCAESVLEALREGGRE